MGDHLLKMSVVDKKLVIEISIDDLVIIPNCENCEHFEYSFSSMAFPCYMCLGQIGDLRGNYFQQKHTIKNK